MMLNNEMESREGRRLCDMCNDSTALLYCKADSAKLCLACDRQVHSTNQLFSKHTRWLLCDSCDSTPATIFCCTEGSVFCQNCDWEAHTNRALSSVHDRRGLEGFSGCPSVSELLGILGLDDVGKKDLLFADDVEADFDGLSDFLVWETPAVVSLDDLVLTNSSSVDHNFEAMVVPPLPKNRNATCGQHKEEMLCQLRELSKLEPDYCGGDGDVEPLIDIESLLSGELNQSEQRESGLDQNTMPKLATSYEGSALHWVGNADKATDSGFSSAFEMNHLVTDKDSDVGDSSVLVSGSHEEKYVPSVPIEPFQVRPRVPVRELNSQERDSAISRYKEKKKSRRYDKRIRYESRKVRAASRTRIRGRFAKIVR